MHDEDRRISVTEPAPSAPVSIVPVAIDTHDDAYFDTRGDATQRTHGVGAPIKWSIADVTTRVLAVRYVPLPHKVIVGSALALSLLILGGAGARSMTTTTTTASSSATTTSNVTSKKHPHAVAASLVARDKDIRSLAQTQGTIALASARSGRWLVVDGKRMSKPSVVVTCGAHMVGVGWDRPTRRDVPCGGSLTADAPAK